jgi:hypothetical protein
VPNGKNNKKTSLFGSARGAALCVASDTEINQGGLVMTFVAMFCLLVFVLYFLLFGGDTM